MLRVISHDWESCGITPSNEIFRKSGGRQDANAGLLRNVGRVTLGHGAASGRGSHIPENERSPKNKRSRRLTQA